MNMNDIERAKAKIKPELLALHSSITEVSKPYDNFFVVTALCFTIATIVEKARPRDREALAGLAKDSIGEVVKMLNHPVFKADAESKNRE